MISSTSNPQVKWVTALQKKAKQRREESLFVVEGLKMVMEAPEDMLVRVYATERFLSEHADMSFKAEPETVSENRQSIS